MARAAAGSRAFPALADDAWIWGGTLDAIQQTITHGIRSGDDEARAVADAALRRRRHAEAAPRSQQVADYVLTPVRQGADGRTSRRARRSSPRTAPPATATRARATASSARRGLRRRHLALWRRPRRRRRADHLRRATGVMPAWSTPARRRRRSRASRSTSIRWAAASRRRTMSRISKADRQTPAAARGAGAPALRQPRAGSIRKRCTGRCAASNGRC